MEAVEVLSLQRSETRLACAAMGIPRATVYRHRDRRRSPQSAPRKRPSRARALSDRERQQVLDSSIRHQLFFGSELIVPG